MAADSPDSAVITSDLETELSRALGELGIGKVDHDTTAILTHAALLRPARGEESEAETYSAQRMIFQSPDSDYALPNSKDSPKQAPQWAICASRT